MIRDETSPVLYIKTPISKMEHLTNHINCTKRHGTVQSMPKVFSAKDRDSQVGQEEPTKSKLTSKN